jgi:predicted AAA+ superfamily ATPase
MRQLAGYPSVVRSADADQKQIVLSEIFDTANQRGVAERYRIRHIPAFKVTINSMPRSRGNRFSSMVITNWPGSQGMGTGKQTAFNYLEAAEDALLL